MYNRAMRNLQSTTRHGATARRSPDTPGTRLTIGALFGWQVYERTMLIEYYRELIQGIMQAAQEHQCNLLLACGMSPSSFPVVLRPALPLHMPGVDFVPVGAHNTDGLILSYPLVGEMEAALLNHLQATQFPFVTIGGPQTTAAVQIDNAYGVEQALQHLRAHGHTRIAFISGFLGDKEGDGVQRLRTYQRCMANWGLPVDPRLIVYGDYAVDGGYHAMQNLLRDGVEFSAVMASDDSSAIGAMRAIREAGLDIPGDIAVIGFDDTLQAALSQPPLTTVRTAPFELGRQAMELLLQRLRAPSLPQASVRFTPRLVLRQSCGCIASQVKPSLPATPAEAAFPDPQTLVDVMAQAVIPFTLHLQQDEVLALCDRLATALLRALESGSPTLFYAEIEDLLRLVTTIRDDAYAWRWALAHMDAVMRHHPLAAPQRAHCDEWIATARETIAEAIQRQHRTYLETQRLRANQMGLLSAQLLTALSEEQIYTILAKQAPELGVNHLAIAFFERNIEGAPERAQFQIVVGKQQFCGTQEPDAFPPRGVYPDDVPFALALLPLGDETDITGYTVFDAAQLESAGALTQQIKVALRMVRLYQTAVDGLQAAEEAGRLKSRFLSMVSHELQTPLRVIVGDSERLLQVIPEQAALQRIAGSARHLDALVRDILDLSSDEIGQLKVTREALDLASTFSSVFAIGAQLAHEKGLAWRVDMPPALPTVWADSARMRQIALNLITNAVKYTPTGSVGVTLSVHDQVVKVEVHDTGVGVPPEEQKLIFSEFYQSSRTQSAQASGLGLGLAISKRLVEMHGGEIGVHSDGRHGASFFFTVPILGAELSPAPPPLTTAGALSHPASILLVDDEPRLLAMHADAIRQQIPGVLVTTAESGVQALEMMHQHPPDLVMLDLRMPGLDGFGVLEQMQATEATRPIPVIILTGQTLGEADMARLRGRVEAVLNKGLLRTDEVMAQLRKALASRADALPGDTHALMRRAIAYIQEHFDAPLTREEVARYVGVSPGYFSRSFRKEAGVSFQEYLNRYRIYQARALLSEGRSSVTEVAYSVGFQNVSYFCQVFRQEVGVSPRMYQKHPPRA